MRGWRPQKSTTSIEAMTITGCVFRISDRHWFFQQRRCFITHFAFFDEPKARIPHLEIAIQDLESLLD